MLEGPLARRFNLVICVLLCHRGPIPTPAIWGNVNHIRLRALAPRIAASAIVTAMGQTPSCGSDKARKIVTVWTLVSHARSHRRGGNGFRRPEFRQGSVQHGRIHKTGVVMAAACLHHQFLTSKLFEQDPGVGLPHVRNPATRETSPPAGRSSPPSRSCRTRSSPAGAPAPRDRRVRPPREPNRLARTGAVRPPGTLVARSTATAEPSERPARMIRVAGTRSVRIK